MKQHACIWSVAVFFVLATAIVAAPPGEAADQKPVPEAPVLSLRPSRRGPPSVPGLARFKPQPVPGVGCMLRAYSPCLSADLKTIVFANWFGRKTEYDLYLATRNAPDGPFGPVDQIEACVTPWTDAWPALSADGLELIFVSSDDAHPNTPPKLFRSRRPRLGAAFPEPEELSLPGIDASRMRLSNPQFVDSLRLKFCLIESPTTRTIRVASRADKHSPFKKVEKLPLENHWLLWWISADGLRAYAPIEEGIGMTYRESVDAEFGPIEVALPADVIGKIDGPIWLSPQEDVIFYCAPGEKGRPDGGRHLMVMAF